MKFNVFYDAALQYAAGMVDSAFSKIPLVERCLNPDYLKLLFAIGTLKHGVQTGERAALDQYVPMAQQLGIVDAKREEVSVDALFAGIDQIMKTTGKVKVLGVAIGTEDVEQLKIALKGAGA